MVVPDVTASKDRARWAYTVRGVLYGSFAWPVMAALVLIFASWWTERPGWRPPEMEWPPRRRR